MTNAFRRPDPGQRGSAMLLVATLLVALLAGGGVALYIQLQNTKGVAQVKGARSALYCAEAGLSVARPLITLNYPTWQLALSGGTTDWHPIPGDLDGDGVDDFNVTIKDNDDEVPPVVNDPTRDVDRQVFAVAQCLKDGVVVREIWELVALATGGHVYRNQGGGGAFNSGNQNQGP
jgi:hypothetical protein